MELPPNSALLEARRQRLINRIFYPFSQFARLEAASGIVLMLSVIIALVWANSPFREFYESILHFNLSIGVGDQVLSKPLEWWINDGLMAIFFLLVGLEIKREIIIGELSSVRKASLPVAAAIGGMVIPALIYLLFARGTTAESGWGIPMATDIAFSLGVLSLLGGKVSRKLGVFLSAFAIADDIGAVLVIAIFYNENLQMLALIAAGIIFLLLLLCNVIGVRSFWPYAILGALLWVAVYQSGIHATIAGILLAITIPAKSMINAKEFVDETQFLIDEFKGNQPLIEDEVRPTDEQMQVVHMMSSACNSVDTPLMRMEHTLQPIVAFFIMPVFALANAGMHLEGSLSDMVRHVSFPGIVLGLVVGKQVGITLFTWLAVKLRLAELPGNMRMKDVYGVSWLGGIGFTMSLFVAALAFPGNRELLNVAKTAILTASVLSGLGGFLLLRMWNRKEEKRLNGQSAAEAN